MYACQADNSGELPRQIEESANGSSRDPRSMARQRLSRERVLQAAIAHADAGGLEALTMRQLAEMLDVAPMALYRHVANKDDLIDAMVDVVFGEIGLPSGGARLEDRHARAGAFAVRCPGAPPLGDRPDGVAEESRSGEPAPPRRGDRQASGGRLRHSDGCPCLRAAGQLHLRLRPDEDEPPVRPGGRGRCRPGHARAVPCQRVPEPRWSSSPSTP